MVYCFKISLKLYILCNSNDNNKDCDFIETNSNENLTINYAKNQNFEYYEI